MKFIFSFFLMFTTIFGSQHLSAQTEDNYEFEQYLRYFWTGDEENLYCVIHLEDPLELPNTYTITTTANGRGCKLICKPSQGRIVFSEEGYQLQEIELVIDVKNTNDPNKIACTEKITAFFKEDGWFVTSTSSETTTIESVLDSPAIDLKEDPYVFLIDDRLDKGVISFKNSFPDSEIQ